MEQIFVHSCKHDGSVRRRWPARVARREGSLIVLDAVFEDEVRHPLIGTIEAGTHSVEFFWTDRWYSVFRFQTPSGSLLRFYCNINTPARLADGVLSFVDLDVDVLVNPDYSHTILDEDEFELNAKLYAYPKDYRDNVTRALDELLRLIESRQFPFDLNRRPSSNVKPETRASSRNS